MQLSARAGSSSADRAVHSPGMAGKELDRLTRVGRMMERP